MHSYVTDSGTDTIKLLVKNFSHRTWWLPNLLCYIIPYEVEGKVKDVKYYPVFTDLKFGIPEFGDEPSVFYVIDYFGKEFGTAEQNEQANKFRGRDVITIRDSVWFPFPFSPLGPNEVWFNSWKKIKRDLHLSTVKSNYWLAGAKSEIGLSLKPIEWSDVELRRSNFTYLKNRLHRYRVRFDPEFPTLFPLRLKNRSTVLPQLVQIAYDFNVQLPGLWHNKRQLDNRLYDELVWLDCRHPQDVLAWFADAIEPLGEQ